MPQTAHRRRRPGVLQDHRPVRSPLAGHPRRAGQPVSPQGTGDSRLARSPTTSPLAPALDPHLELMAQPRAAMVQGTHRSARRRGTFTSVPALIEAIQTRVSHRNQDPQPFIWHAAAGETPEKVLPRTNNPVTSQINHAPPGPVGRLGAGRHPWDPSEPAPQPGRRALRECPDGQRQPAIGGCPRQPDPRSPRAGGELDRSPIGTCTGHAGVSGAVGARWTSSA